MAKITREVFLDNFEQIPISEQRQNVYHYVSQLEAELAEKATELHAVQGHGIRMLNERDAQLAAAELRGAEDFLNWYFSNDDPVEEYDKEQLWDEFKKRRSGGTKN